MKKTNVKKNENYNNLCYFDCETTGVPQKGEKWYENFLTFPKVVQLAWAFGGKERSYIIRPEGWKIPDETSKIHGITQEKALAEGVRFADIINEFLADCESAFLIVAHNIYFDTSIIKAMILYCMGRQYYDEKAETALYNGKRIDTMMKTIRFVGATFANGRPGKYPTLEQLYDRCFPGETFPAHDALQDVRALVRCLPVLVENGIIELKRKEYPAEQLTLQPEKPKEKKIDFNDPDPVMIPVGTNPDNIPEPTVNAKVAKAIERADNLLSDNDF